MSVLCEHITSGFLFEFTCPQWADMTNATQADWNIVQNTCGSTTYFGNPYAASDFLVTLDGIILGDAPIVVSTVDGVTTVSINPATATDPGSMSALDYQKAQTYLEPVSLNMTAADILTGVVTSITVTDTLAVGEYLIGDIVSVINNATGARVKLTVTADSTASTTLAASGTAAVDIPSGAILVPIYSVRVPDQTVVLNNGTGIAVTGTYPTFTITNTTPDQTVALTEGANITITGTYPNFTIAASSSSLWTDGGATTYLTATGDNVAIGATSASTKLRVVGYSTLESGIRYGSSGNGVLSFPFTTNSGSPDATGRNLSFYNYTGGNDASEGAFAFVGDSFLQTTGNAYWFRSQQTFAPTSGTATTATFLLNQTINQTGGASGITRGVYIVPTLTAAVDYRALEISNTSQKAIFQSSTGASNHLAGNTIIGGTGTPARTLEVSGEVRITDLTTDSPTRIVGADADGDLGAITVSTGLDLTAGVLTATGGVSDGDKGDITVSGSGATWTIDNNVVSFAKMQQIGTDKLLGRDAAGTGNVETIALGLSLEFSGSATMQRAALTGDVTAAADSNITTIANDAVTYAKMQNVVNNNRVLGNVGGAGGVVTELTAAQLQTLLAFVDGAGAANRLAYWSDANTLTSNAAFVVDGTNGRVTITNINPNFGIGNANLNFAIPTGGTNEIIHAEGNVSGNILMGIYNVNGINSGANTILTLGTGGTAAGEPMIQFAISGGAGTVTMGPDNSDGDKFKISPSLHRGRTLTRVLL